MKKLTRMYIDMNNCMNFYWGKDNHYVFDLDVLIDETKEFLDDANGERDVEEITEFIREGVYEATLCDEEDFEPLPEECWNILITLVLYECYKERVLTLGYSKE